MAKAEAQTWIDRQTTIQQELDELEPLRIQYAEINRQVAQKNEEWVVITQKLAESERELELCRAEIKNFPLEKQKIQDEIENAEKALKETNKKCVELDEHKQHLSRKISELETKNERLESDRNNLQKDLQKLDYELDQKNKTRIELEIIIGTLTGQKAGLQNEVLETARQKEIGEERALEDLLELPKCLDAEGKPKKKIQESKAIEALSEHLESVNLNYSTRVLKSFHTYLKIADISPLVALAGISGTGKSELPKRYAEAMGIYFLQVSVQPRWDSPQDLFGFYNYLEHRYKATELARAMVRFDHWNWKKYSAKFQNKILLVLLDEMNLARVEYYFSEFLSRLEGRKSVDTDSELSRHPVEIELDLGKQKEQLGARSVFPSSNVLFVGTMNEDESTQSMSDKVMDRAPIIRFGRPKKLANQLPKSSSIKSGEFLTLETWLGWRKQPDSIPSKVRDPMEKWIEKLNVSLDGLGRPFGHRLNQAIYAYVANHPDTVADPSLRSARVAFSDQLEQRIFPKLRGLQMLDGSNERHFNDMRSLIRNELEDADLDQALHDSAQDELFSWTGVDREKEN